MPNRLLGYEANILNMKKIKRRSQRRPIKCQRRKCLLYCAAILGGLLLSFVTIILTFYISSNYLANILSNVFLWNPRTSRTSPISSENIENYQPKDFPGKKQSLRYDSHIKYKDFNYLNPTTLTYRNETFSNDIQILIRFPQMTSTQSILIIFHECRSSAYDWFHTAERQRIIGAAIDLGYACLVFQRLNRNSSCWSYTTDVYANDDVRIIERGLNGFYQRHPDLETLPRVTFGVSSGGIFSSIYSTNLRYPIHAQILHTAIISPEVLHNYVKPGSYPPTVWIHMLRDIEFASEARISMSKNILMSNNILCKTLPIEPIYLSPVTFSSRIPTLNRDTSMFLFHRLSRNGWINNYKILKYNPRRNLLWKTFFESYDNRVPDNQLILNNINANKYALSEFLNTIYGEHEISYERSYEALKWIGKWIISSKT